MLHNSKKKRNGIKIKKQQKKAIEDKKNADAKAGNDKLIELGLAKIK